VIAAAVVAAPVARVRGVNHGLEAGFDSLEYRGAERLDRAVLRGWQTACALPSAAAVDEQMRSRSATEDLASNSAAAIVVDAS
jgi:hypothetical protein